MSQATDRRGPVGDLVHDHLCDNNLVRIILSGLPSSAGTPWHRVIIRPVQIGERGMLQIQRYDDRHCDTTNLDTADLDAHPVLNSVLASPYRNVTVQLTERRIQGRVTKRGKLLSSSAEETATVDTRHDRGKKRWIPQDAPFLELLTMARDGRVVPSAQRKYRQINEFVRAIAETPDLVPDSGEPVRIVDFGCGNAYLTFAVFHHFAVELGLRCELTGVDRDARTIERNQARADALGLPGLRFVPGDIGDTPIPVAPTIVIALHACDTATDDAIARAVAAKAGLILVAPCCHQHLQKQLAPATAPPGFEVTMANPVLRDRLGDVLTDSARVELLRMAGYQTRVLQFATLTDTAKNLLIKAIRTEAPAPPDAEPRYRSLTEAWQVTPYLEAALKLEVP